MGLLADSLRERGLVGPSEEQPAGSTLSTGVTGEFGKGLNSGLTGIGGGLRAVAGTIGETFGADQFAQDQYRRARESQQRAGREAPRVTSFKGVGSLRDGVHYAAGLLGGSAPSIALGTGAALATGGGAVPGLIAATAAQTPIEMGDVAMKQLNDPDAMAMSPGERSLRQFSGGLASAGLQSVVPNILAGKIAGRTAGEAAKKTTGQIVGSNLAAVPQEGFFEGASDALKQTASNDNRALDWDSVAESAVGGAVAGGAMSTVGAGAELLQAGPAKSWIGAKGLAQDALQTGQDALSSAKDAVDPIWDQIKPSVDAGLQAMRSGAADAWGAMPESVKGAGEFLKGSFEDQVDSTQAALKRIQEADDIPTAIKQQALESGRSLGLAANRAYVWSVDQTRNAMGAPKAAVPQSISDRLRGLTTPKDDTADRVAAGTPLGDEDFTNATPDMVQRSDSKAAEWAKTKGTELLNRTGLSDEKKAQLTQALGDVTDQANRAVVAGIAKSTQAFDALSKRVDAAYEGIKAGIAESQAKGGAKKSEDYSGFERQVVERAAPILQESHPELFEAEGAKLLKRIGATLSMFMRSAADGQMVRLKTLNGVVEDMLGKEPAERVLDSLYGLIEGNEEQVNNFYKVRAEMAQEAATREPLESMLAEFSTNEAASRSGINSDPKEWATFLRDWAQGGLTSGMPPAQAAFENKRVQDALIKHFGTKAKNILAALDREVEQTRKDSGVGKNQFDSDEAMTGEDGEQSSEEKDVDSRYFDANGEASESPKLYERPDLAKGKGGFKSATQQALNRFREANPDSRVYFVPLRDYAKARSLTEEEMRVLSGGADPSAVGYLKAERIKDDDSLRPNEVQRMRMDTKYVKNKQGVMNPDAINVPGTTTHYDSKRIANIMHTRAKDDWSEAERATGWKGRMARKFTEGIAALSAMHGKNLEVRDDQVIATSGGKNLTWGEAKKVMAETDTSSLPDFLKNATKGELKLHEIIPDLSDTELKSSIVKVTDARDAILEPIEAEIKEQVREEFGDAKYHSNKSDQIYREVKKRVKEAMQDEGTGLPKLTRLLQGLEYELDKRSGEDRRTSVMNTGMETREGIQVKRKWTSALERFMAGEADTDASYKPKKADTGRTEGDPEGNIHDSAATMSAKDLERNNTELQGKFPDVKEILSRAALIMESESPVRQKLYDRVVKLAMNSAAMSGKDRDVLLESARRDSIVDFSSVVNDMARKYAASIVAPGAKAEPKADLTRTTLDKYREYITNPPDDFSIDRAKEIAAWAKEQEERLTKRSRALEAEGGDLYDRVYDLRIDARLLKEKANEVVKSEAGRMEIEGEGTPDPKQVAAKKAAFLERAVSGDKDLIKELSTSNDAKGLQRAVEALYDVQGADAALQAANARLGELVASNPDVAYGLQTKKYSLDATRATGTPLTAKGREQIKAYLRSTTPWASVAFPNMPQAGEFTVEEGEAIVRVSAHALNPLSVAYHESLHAFFQHLGDGNMRDVIKTVMQTASKPAVAARLRELLAHSPEAQAQLKDVEERAAYMYQFWAQGDEKLIAAMGEKSTTFFGKLADYFRKLLGVWSNDERALRILEYFSSGEYGANVGKPDAAYEAMMETGRNAALEKLKSMSKGFMEMGEAVWGAGSANLRDSGIPALAKIADLVKRKSTDEGSDAGFLPAARIARAQHLDKLANTIGSVDEAVAHEALEALQTGTTAKGADAERVRVAVRATLDDMYTYLSKAGVRVNDMGLGKDYFPRRWDATYLSKNKQKFMDMARNYPDWNDPEATFNRLVSADGSEMPTVHRPGMASKQERLLSFISAEDAAPFMSKNLYQIMNSYVSQATRRAEWARRFTDTNKTLEDLLAQATEQGASSKQVEEAKRFVEGVNGTLGDNINPNLRRYMGNMVVYQNLRLLPLAVFSSVVDPMGVMVRGGSVGQAWGTFKRAIREVPAGLKGQEVKDYWTDMSEALGVIESATLNNALGSLYLQGAVGDTARKINDKFFRFNLMEQWNRSMHVGAAEAAVNFIAKHKDLKGPHSARYLAELGLKPEDIQLVDGRMKLTVADGLSEAHAAKIKVAVNLWVDGAILRPDAADKPVWMNDPHYMLVAHLKQFVYAFHHTIIDRVVHEFKHGNANPALALTSYVPVMIAADAMKGFLVNGGDEPEWKKAWGPGEYLMNGVERAGLFGVGQFGVDALTGNAGSLAGPTLGQLGEAIQVGGGNKQFESLFIRSLPANAVYAPTLKAESSESSHPTK